jgi:hydroxypyruvate isomerase
VQIANPPDRREPGNGEIDYRYILETFDRLGYDGWIGCEYRPTGSTVESLGWIRDYGVVPPKKS